MFGFDAGESDGNGRELYPWLYLHGRQNKAWGFECQPAPSLNSRPKDLTTQNTQPLNTTLDPSLNLESRARVELGFKRPQRQLPRATQRHRSPSFAVIDGDPTTSGHEV